jgi:hypothetical protein
MPRRCPVSDLIERDAVVAWLEKEALRSIAMGPHGDIERQVLMWAAGRIKAGAVPSCQPQAQETTRYEITVSGCDDSTRIETELTGVEFAFVSKLAERITEASTYGCMPTMHVAKLPPAPGPSTEATREDSDHG